MSLANALIREASESVNAVHDPSARFAQQVGYLQATIRMLCSRYAGEGAKPKNGCALATMTAGDASVLVEYEYEPAEEANFDLESPMVGPGHEATVSIIQALLNGAWCDSTDVFSEALIERWAEAIAESEAQVARDQKEGADRDRYDDARDFAASQDEHAELRGGAYAVALGAMR